MACIFSTIAQGVLKIYVFYYGYTEQIEEFIGG